MNRPTVKVSYWTHSDTDFENIEQFKIELSQTYEVDIKRQTSDALGGWLFQIILEIYNDLNFREFLKSYVEDGVKIGIGLFGKEIFHGLKRLFDKNLTHQPGISELRLFFKDTEIVIYSTYDGSVEDIAEELTHLIFSNYSTLETIASSTICSIHVPLFYRTEKIDPLPTELRNAFEISSYRVRLNVDETIRHFSRSDYFKLWGVRCNDVDFVYDMETRTAVSSKFFTEREYWNLWNRKYEESTKL